MDAHSRIVSNLGQELFRLRDEFKGWWVKGGGGPPNGFLELVSKEGTDKEMGEMRKIREYWQM